MNSEKIVLKLGSKEKSQKGRFRGFGKGLSGDREK